MRRYFCQCDSREVSNLTSPETKVTKRIIKQIVLRGQGIQRHLSPACNKPTTVSYRGSTSPNARQFLQDELKLLLRKTLR